MMLSFTVSSSQTPRITFINSEDIIHIKAPKSFILNIGFNRIFGLASMIKQIFSLFNSFAILEKFSNFQNLNSHNQAAN